MNHPSPADLEAYAYEAAEADLAPHLTDCRDCTRAVARSREERDLLFVALAPTSSARPSERPARHLAAAAAVLVVAGALWLSAPEAGRRSAWGPEPMEVGRPSRASVGLRGAFQGQAGWAGLLFDGDLYGTRPDGRPWTVPGFLPEDPAGIASAPLAVGGRIEAVAWDGRAIVHRVQTFDGPLASAALPPPPAGALRALELAARGDLRFALAEHARSGPGMLSISRSADAGRTWGPWHGVATNTLKHGQHGLVVLDRSVHVFFVDYDGAAAHVRSDDGGITWDVDRAPPLPKPVDFLRATAGPRGLHVVCAVRGEEGGRILHSSGGPPSLVAASLQVPFEARQSFQVRSTGTSLVCTVPGPTAHIFRSDDGGDTWHSDDAATAGLPGPPASAVPHGRPDGAVLFGLHLRDADGGHRLLVRVRPK